MTPRRNAAVVRVSRTKGQNRAVSKFSITAMEPPLASITEMMPMPPMWNSGMLMRKRSSPCTKCQVSGPALVKRCR
jgi:hypothetical protein